MISIILIVGFVKSCFMRKKKVVNLSIIVSRYIEECFCNVVISILWIDTYL